LRKLLLPAVDAALVLVLVLCSGFDFTELALVLAVREWRLAEAVVALRLAGLSCWELSRVG